MSTCIVPAGNISGLLTNPKAHWRKEGATGWDAKLISGNAVLFSLDFWFQEDVQVGALHQGERGRECTRTAQSVQQSPIHPIYLARTVCCVLHCLCAGAGATATWQAL